MSAYSMPLCTIFTKCPAPSVPMWVQHGAPSTCAEIFSRIGPSDSYDLADPPGMMDGPFSAPSSPPETPQPTKWMPFSCSAACRRRVSSNFALPPSMMMSPGSTSSASSSMTASVGPPALTMIRIFRGTAREATKSAEDSDGTKVPSPPKSSISAFVFAYDRLCTAVTNPLRAKLRARLEPITARPVTPISAFGVVSVISKPPGNGKTVRTNQQPSAPLPAARGGVSLGSGGASADSSLHRGGNSRSVGAAGGRRLHRLDHQPHLTHRDRAAGAGGDVVDRRADQT